MGTEEFTWTELDRADLLAAAGLTPVVEEAGEAVDPYRDRATTDTEPAGAPVAVAPAVVDPAPPSRPAALRRVAGRVVRRVRSGLR